MRRTVWVSVFMVLLLALFGCSKKVGVTTVSTIDSVRHYYPIVAGEELGITYQLVNTGKEPLVITDIQPSCGCIASSVSKKVVPPGDSIPLQFTFHSKKNIGYVRHTIRVFGNVLPKGVVNLIFDVNVVPPADYTPDYEELFQKEVEEKSKGVDGLVDGRASQKGYYVDPAKDSRSHVRYPWREEN